MKINYWGFSLLETLCSVFLISIIIGFASLSASQFQGKQKIKSDILKTKLFISRHIAKSWSKSTKYSMTFENNYIKYRDEESVISSTRLNSSYFTENKKISFFTSKICSPKTISIKNNDTVCHISISLHCRVKEKC